MCANPMVLEDYKKRKAEIVTLETGLTKVRTSG
jgi:hypothetical protein